MKDESEESFGLTLHMSLSPDALESRLEVLPS